MRLNVQADVRERLAESLAPIPVRVSVPNPRPATLVVVVREGGHRLNRLQDRAGLAVYTWAETEADASALADRISGLLFKLPFSAGYDLVEEESLKSDPDPDTGTPRWYGSYTLTTHHYD